MEQKSGILRLVTTRLSIQSYQATSLGLDFLLSISIFATTEFIWSKIVKAINQKVWMRFWAKTFQGYRNESQVYFYMLTRILSRDLITLLSRFESSSIFKSKLCFYWLTSIFVKQLLPISIKQPLVILYDSFSTSHISDSIKFVGLRHQIGFFSIAPPVDK